MPLLNTADKVYLGTTAVDAIYLGANKVWPSGPLPIPVTDGLLGWYDLSALADPADAASVALWPDSSGNGLDLATTGSPPRYDVNGGDGNAAVSWWDGTTRSLETTANTGLAGAAPWTQVLIIKRGTTGNQNITGIGTPGAAQMTDLLTWSSNTVIGHMYGGGNDTIGYGPPTLNTDGAFHILAATYNGGLRLSVDGVKQSSPWPGALGLVNAPFRVGGGMYSGFPGLGGGAAIRGVALYARALSDAEISTVASALGSRV